jgi:type IV pilus assembly protein PilA
MINLKNKGFTLIELLVVIAIIGILSAVVLASLGTARNKGKAASAIGSLNSMRAQAELSVALNGTYPANICSNSSGTPLKTLIDAVVTQSGGSFGTTVLCNTPTANSDGTFNAWAASASTTVVSFCVDSTGYAGSVKKVATLGVCI